MYENCTVLTLNSTPPPHTNNKLTLYTRADSPADAGGDLGLRLAVHGRQESLVALRNLRVSWPIRGHADVVAGEQCCDVEPLRCGHVPPDVDIAGPDIVQL